MVLPFLATFWHAFKAAAYSSSREILREILEQCSLSGEKCSVCSSGIVRAVKQIEAAKLNLEKQIMCAPRLSIIKFISFNF